MVQADHQTGLQAVLAHELAHVRGGDLAWMLLSRWVAILLWFHPLAWRLRAAHESACESVCDTVAAEYMGSVDSYSRVLAEVALAGTPRWPTLGAVPMVRPAHIVNRLRQLRKQPACRPLGRYPATLATTLGLGLLTLLGGLQVAYAQHAARAEQQQRILHFPQNASLGQLKIRLDRNSNWHYISQTKGEYEWAFLGEAQGQVRVPTDLKIGLQISNQGLAHMGQLRRLRPDDFWAVWLPSQADNGSLQSLAPLTELRELSLAGKRITNRGLRALEQLPSLHTLRLPEQLAGLTALRHVADCTQLRNLQLQGRLVNDASLAALTKLTNLEELRLGGDRVSPDGLAQLAALPSLRYLFFWSEHCDDAALEAISQIKSLRQLRFGRDIHITHAGVAHLTNLPKLEDLSLFDTPITDIALVHVSKMHQLKRLKLDQAEVTDAGLASITSLQALEMLSVPAHITDRGLQHIAQLRNLQCLWAGSSSKSTITDAGLKHISQLPRLRELLIGGTGITDTGLGHIAQLTHLEHLSIFQKKSITNEGLRHLAGLKRLTNLDIHPTNATITGLNQLNILTELWHLGVSGIEDDGAVLDLSGLRKLEKLGLGGPGIGDEDLACLATLTNLEWFQMNFLHDNITNIGLSHLAGLTRMERLAVCGQGITDKGLTHLQDMSRLNYLVVNGQITDAGLIHLENLQQLRLLRLLTDDTFSDDALDRLEAQLPYLHTLQVNDPGMLRGSAGGRTRRRGGR